MLRVIVLKKTFLPIISLCFLTSCSNLKTEGNFGGNEYKASNELTFTYALSENVKLKSKISQPYIYKNSIDKHVPDYAESGVFFDF